MMVSEEELKFWGEGEWVNLTNMSPNENCHKNLMMNIYEYHKICLVSFDLSGIAKLGVTM